MPNESSYTPISILRGSSSMIDETPIVDGQILFDEGRKCLYMDEGVTRNKYSGLGADSNVATVEDTTTATHAYVKGNYVVVEGQLYEVTAAIAIGDTFTVGTNVAVTTVGTELSQINSDLTNKVSKTGDTMTGNLTIQKANAATTWIDMNGNVQRRKVWEGFANSTGEFFLYDATLNRHILRSGVNGDINIGSTASKTDVYSSDLNYSDKNIVHAINKVIGAYGTSNNVIVLGTGNSTWGNSILAPYNEFIGILFANRYATGDSFMALISRTNEIIGVSQIVNTNNHFTLNYNNQGTLSLTYYDSQNTYSYQYVLLRMK